ncbi:hypothetical protein EYF80_043881 [Liparis tanakae]|uniref:Uncharacterized protein n=1 Tax=Liparis tanakae TaxID=230148 RepID=A0A4Z2G056_9TELE|nr:hypothetical protein EYF80_043881 [Liparis tanakae]
MSGIPLRSRGPRAPSGSSCSLGAEGSGSDDAVPDVAQPGSHLNGVTRLDHVLHRAFQLRKRKRKRRGRGGGRGEEEERKLQIGRWTSCR